jgi:hypothetical protein
MRTTIENASIGEEVARSANLDDNAFACGFGGWSWYRLENAEINGQAMDPAQSRWYKSGIFPNVWHFGAGLEYMPWKQVGKYFDGVEIALRVEYARYYQTLGLDLSEIPLDELRLLFATLDDIPGSDRVVRDEFLFGLSISF